MALLHSLELYIPSKCHCGRPIDPDLCDHTVAEAKNFMGYWFGGGSEIEPGEVDNRGVWFSDSGEYVPEHSHIVFSNSDSSHLAQHSQDFLDYAAELANRLCQEQMACRIDGHMYWLPGTGVCPHGKKLAGEKRSAKDDQNFERKGRLIALRAGLASMRDVGGLRDVFCNFLHYDETNVSICTSKWPSSVAKLLRNPAEITVVAAKNGFQIVHVPMCTRVLHYDEERMIVRQLLADLPEFRGVCVFSDSACEHWHLVYPGCTSTRRGTGAVRRIRISQREVLRTTVEQLASLDLELLGDNPSAADVENAFDSAFDVQSVVDGFFREYESSFREVSSAIRGFSDGEVEQRRLHVQQFFNRMMFLEFVQRKGWLRFNGSKDYLRALWDEYSKSRSPESCFYRDRLKPLFFQGLNTEPEKRPHLEPLIGSVPYLNGGLFEPTDADKREAVFVPDEAVKSLLFDLFAHYNFTVVESTLLDEEVAVDPEMLGRVFEELINKDDRKQTGSYYTPRPIVTFMCREALKIYLAASCPEETRVGINAFVDERDPTELRYPEKLLDALRRVRVCDPACGSGAYLLGMLHEILELRTCMFLAKQLDPISMYNRKLEIIQNNLFGVDIERFAVNIARLRLWLSLAVEFDGDVPPALPNLDFKIEVGDSVTGPSPQLADTEGFRCKFVSDYQLKKQEYMRANHEERGRLIKEINELRHDIAEWTARGDKEPVFDWALDFAEVFADGGFDIVLSNPPFVKQERITALKPDLERAYGDLYGATADLYVFFYIRGLQILRPGGVLSFISSNKWFRTTYGAKLRNYITATSQVISITDFGELPVFKSASTFPAIFIAQRLPTHGLAADRPGCVFTQVKSLNPPYPDVKALVKNGQVLPGNALDGANWVLASEGEADLVRQMRLKGSPLRTCVANRIYRGIVTGRNEAFYIDDLTRERLIEMESGSSEIIHPVIVGEDVRRWQVGDSRRWVIFTQRGIDIDAYPAVKEYLLGYRARLEPKPKDWNGPGEWHGRKPGTYQWYEIQDQVKYHSAFAEKKIVYPDLSGGSKFAFDKSGLYLDNTVSCIVTSDLYLLGVLNSSCVWEYIEAVFPFNGDPNGMGRARLKTVYVQDIPIPSPGAEERAAIADLASKCVEAKGVGCEEWEKEIDERVASLYGIKCPT